MLTIRPSRDSKIDSSGRERLPVDDKKRKIDQEIEKRIREEQERRKKAVGAYESMRKITEKTENYDDFRYTPLSTEKSRSKEVVSRLNLEKKLREEKINKYTEIVNKSRVSKSPSRVSMNKKDQNSRRTNPTCLLSGKKKSREKSPRRRFFSEPFYILQN
eukprot:TRINITY_DN818_c0_g2_i2.p2 TRINITY_DN818_c0_g2~~TRINITY_DN818_c0_g2_i2.p2  ORF type:complete len:160 (-),score=49.72 TRINITY_DN818_c0_g2_i2:139-618(-)